MSHTGPAQAKCIPHHRGPGNCTDQFGNGNPFGRPRSITKDGCILGLNSNRTVVRALFFPPGRATSIFAGWFYLICRSVAAPIEPPNLWSFSRAPFATVPAWRTGWRRWSYCRSHLKTRRDHEQNKKENNTKTKKNLLNKKNLEAKVYLAEERKATVCST
jgi:hypothetical protein